DKARGFDFGEAPLLRIHLVRLGGDRYYLLRTYHHAILDGWCTPIVLGDVLAYYRSFVSGAPARLPAAPAYSDYVAWLSRRDQARARDYWRAQVGSVTAPTPLVLDGLARADATPGEGRLDVVMSD